MAFKKGESGNLSGKPTGTRNKTTISRNRKCDAVKVLESVMKDSSVDAASRVQAAALILYSQNAA